ncbi:hypothetical protein CCO03_00270 [Comamonas serinivorans]|uniref:Alpha-2-macroglobulin n=1 Tax=Comamonas serinivorans TaxID=1082851 RepID=A0A1Y0EIT5_9BURK|nr:MG2 domain-containing protein [Comamonas serinivorans]ARU03331.1 hypothetical protein CCO03_00270 [Comamonas serinivorans]
MPHPLNALSPSCAPRPPTVRWAVLALAAVASLSAQAASVTVTPQADVRSLRQVSLRFDTPMTALGRSDAAAPAEVRCAHPNAATRLPAGQGRWVNERDWAFEFSAALPAGTQCEVLRDSRLRNSAGEAVSGPARTRFRILPVGYHQLQLLQTEQAQASYTALLQHPDPAGGRAGLARNPFVCDVLDAAGQQALAELPRGAPVDLRRWLRTQPTEVVSEARVREMHGRQLNGDRPWALALRCAQPLPDGAQVRLRRQNDTENALNRALVAGDAEGRERFVFQTREPFVATLACEQERAHPWPLPRPTGPQGRASARADERLRCDTRLPIALNLSSPVPVAAGTGQPAIEWPRLRVGPQSLAPTLVYADDRRQTVRGLTWRVDPRTPAPQEVRLTGGSLRDVQGRLLANPAALGTTFVLQPPPPYLGAVPNTGALLPLQAPDSLRRLLFATRGLEPQLAATQWRITQLDTLAQRRAAAVLVSATQAPDRLNAADWDELAAHWPAPRELSLQPRGAQIQLNGLPLQGAGLHVARVRSTAYDAHLVQQRALEEQAQAPAPETLRAAGMSAGARPPVKPGLAPREPLPAHPGERWGVAQLSNLAVTANLAAAGPSLLWVTAIDAGKPMAGARVWLYDCRLQPIWQGETDAQGVAQLPTGAGVAGTRESGCSQPRSRGVERLLPADERWVRVEAGDDRLFSTLPTGRHSYAPSRSGWHSHLVLDRSLLQPGDTLHLQLVARQPTAEGWALPERQAVRVHIVHESGEQLGPLSGELDAQGQVSLQWAVPANVKLGRFRLEAQRVDGDVTLAQASFRVEEFRRPVFDAGLSSTATPGSRQLGLAGRLRFFSGGSAEGEPVQWQHRWSPHVMAPVDGYTFFTPTRAQDLQAPPALTSAPGKLDTQGTVAQQLALPTLGRPWRVDSEMQFADPNGETQTVASHATVWPTGQRLGLTLQAATATAPTRVAGVLVGADGQPLPEQRVRLQVSEARSRHVNAPGGGGGYWEAQAPQRPLCDAVTDARGRWECPWPQDLRPKGYGDMGTLWLVQAQLAATPTVQTALAVNGWQVARRQSEDELTVLNGTAFTAGEVAQVQTRARRLPASLLLTLEREGVRSHRVIALQQPEQRIEVPLAAHDAPNVHLRAQYVYPWQEPATAHRRAPDVDEDDNAFPQTSALRGHTTPRASDAVGLYEQQQAELSVSPASFALQTEVKPLQDEVRPGSALPVAVQVRDAQGEPAAHARLTLAVVDEALLALQPNTTWALSEAMWRARPNQVGVRSVLPGVAVQPVAPLAPDWIAPDERPAGGRMALANKVMAPAAAPAPSSVTLYGRLDEGQAAAPADAAAPPRSEFSSLLLWQTQVQTDAQGRAQVSVPVNDSLTRFRVVALATQGADRFGEGQAHFVTTQPLQLLSGLPALVRSGDELVQKLTVRNTGRQALAVQLGAQATRVGRDDAPALRALDAAAEQERGLSLTRQLSLAPGATQTVLWRLRVPDGVSQLDWQFTATGKAGKTVERDTLKLTQRVKPAVEPTVRAATLLQLGAQPGTLAVAQPTGALPQVGGVRVSLSASLVDSVLQETRRWMRDYPYTCLEQQSSRAVVLDDRAAWDRLMAQLPKYLDAQGLARFFPEPSLSGSEMLTLQLLDLSHATGWALPADARTHMLQAVQQLLAGHIAPQDWSPREDRRSRQLAAQATLAEHGQTVSLREVPEDLSALPAQSLIDWARTLAALPAAQRPAGPAGDPRAVSDQLRSRFDVQGSVLRWRDEVATQWWWFMWSGDGTTARMALLAQQLSGGDAQWQSDVPRIVQGLVARQSQGRWYSTSANAWASVALNRFAQQREAGPVSGTSVLTLGAQQRRADWAAQQAPTQLLPWPQQGGTATLGLQQQGSGQPWATVATLAAVRLTAPAAHGLGVTREVLPVQQRTPGQWSVGDVYRVRLTVTSNAPQTWVVVRDALPSGATPLNRGLGRDSALATTDGRDARRPWDWRARPSFEEHAADSYRAYYRWVGEGHWPLEYTVRLNNAGRFELPPTRVEALYAPEVFGEAPAASITVVP